MLQDGYLDNALELARSEGYDPNGGLRGGKYSLFNGGTHVPFIVYWKGHIRPSVSDAYICQVDLFVSLGKLIGGSVPSGLDSQEHLSVLLGRKLHGGRRAQVLEAKSKLALRWKNYEMIPPYSGKECNSTGNEIGNLREYALFDMDADPGEKHNLASEKPRLLRKMQRMYTRMVGPYYKSGLEDEPLQ